MQEPLATVSATPPHRRGGSLLHALRAVGWSFFGVRKSADHAQDMGQLNPLHIVVAGLLALLVFIGGLLLLVDWVLSSGVAT